LQLIIKGRLSPAFFYACKTRLHLLPGAAHQLLLDTEMVVFLMVNQDIGTYQLTSYNI